MTTAAEAIHEALLARDGLGSVADVQEYVHERYPQRWAPTTIATLMADLTYPGNPTSAYPTSKRFLERVGSGRYRLRSTTSTVSPEPPQSVQDDRKPTHPDLQRVRGIYGQYVEARNALLAELNLGRNSNRDPLAEFAEWLVAALLGGTLAPSPVQAHWDVEAPGVGKVQVKYLANSGSEGWVNEHPVHVTEQMDAYAIVFYESLLPVAVAQLPARRLAEVGAALGKRHPNQDRSLQLTRANYMRLLGEPTTFRPLGVRVWRAPDWSEG
jgi:hypothetical protein